MLNLRSLLALAPLVAALPATPHAHAHAQERSPIGALPDLSVQDWAGVQSGFGLKDVSDWAWSKAHDLVYDRHSTDASETESGQVDGDETQLTIWQRLKADEHSFSRLTGLIEFVGGKPKEILDDRKLSITFFAPNNDALKPPEHHHGGDHHHHDHDHDGALLSLMQDGNLASISAHFESLYSASALEEHKHRHHHHDGDDDDDEKKKRRREIFKKIAAKVLAYHGLPTALTAAEVAQNSTLVTGLKAEDGSYAGLHRRVRVEKTLLPPSVKLNFYARIEATDRKAINGYFHTINHPLIPPGSIFDSLYLFPDFFSTLTSAVQGTGGRDYLDWSYDREASKPGKPKFEGSPVATFFAPTNAAFGLLPPKLKFFLFSPFGERVLRKVLAYHYVPHSIVLSEFQYHEKHEKHEHKEEEAGKMGFEAAVEQAYESENSMWGWNVADDPSFHKELEVHSGLPNATLNVVIDKTKPVPIEGVVKTTIRVNNVQVQTIDVPARNGAFHVLPKLLVPPHHHHDEHGQDVAHEDSWENWEEWLPAFAAEA